MLSKALEINDLYKLAKKRVPKMFFEYVDNGSWSGSTYRNNEKDFQNIKFKQRVARDMTGRKISTKMVGQDVSMPVALAPIGICGMQYPEGEILAAKAAEEGGIPFALSTMSVCSIEDVAKETLKPFWFQLYMMKDRDFMEDLIGRARKVKCSALIVTLDLQVMGQRHNDIRNHLTAPPKLNFNTFSQFITRPHWCIQMLGTQKHSFGNIVGHVKSVSNLASLATWTAEQFDESLNWSDISWIRERWPGQLILKGIMDLEDANKAVQTGADAIIVSNHGGRQLDGAPSTISILAGIVDEVGEQIEVHFDGGIRSGQDAFRALCVGAKGTYIGRPYVYGLGAGGQEGVKPSIEIIRKELDLTMALCGENKIINVGRHNIAKIPSDYGIKLN